MVAELASIALVAAESCSLAKISMVAEPYAKQVAGTISCSLAKISMVAELLILFDF